MFRLSQLGWIDFFAKQISKEENASAFPVRVSEENRGIFRVICEEGEFLAEISGKLRHEAVSRADLPAVGDWVLADRQQSASRVRIRRVLKRFGKFSRKVAGKKIEEQIVAANVDTVFLVSSLNLELNVRRIERYLTLAWESGAKPVIVLNKVDLCKDMQGENVSELLEKVEAAAMGIKIVVASAERGDGIAELREIVRSAGTTALLGSSGVGKSTLINAILGEERQVTSAVRHGDDRGRHTTTTRQLIVMPDGGVLVDTPGMRELQLWDAAEGVEHAFSDVHELASECRFRDCTHNSEPGCAVREGMEEGRLENYHKMLREEKFLESKQDASLRAQKKKEMQALMKGVNRFYRERGR